MSELYEVEVRSSNGNLTIDIYGNILKSDYTGENPPVRFDVVEWIRYHKQAEMPTSLDILDIGYWLVDGTYEPAVDDWREMRVKIELEDREDDSRYKAPGR